MSNSSSTNQFTVTLVNTDNDQQLYTRSWTSSQYSGKFVAELTSDGNFILLKDETGFLLLLGIEYEEGDDEPIITEISLEEASYKDLFTENAVVSLTDIAVIVYAGGKLTYFQAFE